VSSVAMEDLFQSTSRMRDYLARFRLIILARFPDEFEGRLANIAEYLNNAEFVEVELTALGRKILRNVSWPWTEFARFVEEKIVWMGDTHFIDGICYDFEYEDDGFGDDKLGTLIGYDQVLRVVVEDDSLPERAQELIIWSHPSRAKDACSSMLLCLTNCEAELLHLSVTEDSECHPVHCQISARLLSRLSQSRGFQKLSLLSFEFSEIQCRVLSKHGRKDLAMELRNCSPVQTEWGERLLLDGIRRNRGPN